MDDDTNEHEPNRAQSGNDSSGDDGDSRDTSSQAAPLGDTGTALRDENQSLESVNPLDTGPRQESGAKSEIQGANDPLGNAKEIPQEGSEQDGSAQKSIGASGLRSDPTASPPNRCGEPLITVTLPDIWGYVKATGQILNGVKNVLSPDPTGKVVGAIQIGTGVEMMSKTVGGVLVDRPMQRVSDEVRFANMQAEVEQKQQISQAAAGFRSGIRVQ